MRTSFAIFALFLCKMRNSVQSQLAGGEKACTASLVERERVEKDERELRNMRELRKLRKMRELRKLRKMRVKN